MIKRMAALLALVSALVIGVVATPAQAASGVYCGANCNGEDPNTYWAYLPGGKRFLCASDAITAKVKEGTGMYGRTLQLRYSPTCRTVWGRVYGGANNDVVVLELWDGSTWQNKRMQEITISHNWGDMWDDAGVTIRTCLQLNWFTNTRLGCTAGY